MTPEDIIRMAEQAGWDMPNQWDDTCGFSQRLERFAALAIAAEREACAKMCEDWPIDQEYVYSIGVAIRARGEK